MMMDLVEMGVNEDMGFLVGGWSILFRAPSRMGEYVD